LKTLTLNSFAKLNLYLSVRNKLSDGYHSLQTVFERINVCDKVVLRVRRDDKIVCLCDDPGLPADSRNLAVKAALLLSRRYAVGKGATIRLIKRIPQGAGMAGGSSNAAAVLIGLNRLWRLGLSKAELCSIASRVGSDVAFFIHECRFALAEGKGEKVRPVRELRKRLLWHVILVPDLHASTPLIYKQWDKLRANKNIDISRLTRPVSGAKLILSALRQKSGHWLEQCLFNGLEAAAIDLYPGLARVRRVLTMAGVPNICMTGSGSAFFGIVSSRKEALRFSRRLKKLNRRWHVFVARTV